MARKGEIPFYSALDIKENKSEIHENPYATLKKLVIVRHGDYDGKTLNLNDSGKKQIETLGETIKGIIDKEGFSAIIVSSPSKRALQSAQILAKFINSPIEEDALLLSPVSEETPPSQLKAILNLVDSKSANANMLILVTHAEHCEAFPKFFGENKLGQKWHGEFFSKGAGQLINCETKTKSFLLT